jgi:monoamine oxidase
MSDENSSPDIDRRRFIKGAGAGTLAAGLGGHAAMLGAAGTSGKTPFDYDTLVIGGGFAGVTAARDLKENGYSCAILEVRHRLGGRTYYAPFGNTHVELGGTWIHWMQPFVWTEVMRYGLEIKETPGATAERIIQLKDGKAIEPDINKFYSDLLVGGQGLVDRSRSVWPRPFDAAFNMKGVLQADTASIADLLDSLELTDSQHKVYETLLVGGTNASISDVSANEALRIFALCGHNVGSYYDVNARYQLKDGSIALINSMIEDGKPEVKLNTYVKRIEQKTDHVVVSTAAGEVITAAAVVCTVPLNVLKDVEFIVIEEAFAYQIGDDSSLIACFGKDQGDVDIYDKKYLQATLRKYLPDIEVTGSTGYGWTDDPFAQGTWCTWRPGWYREGRVFFASSDFCEGSRGYIDGAMGSGIKAAQQISELLG